MPEPDDSTARYLAWRSEVRSMAGALAPRRKVVGFTPKVAWSDGGNDPIDEVFAVAVDVPMAHWTYVGAGLMGFGFELVLRLRRDPTAQEPPEWPVEVLQNLGRYVCSSGNRLRPRDWMPLYKPLTWAVPTQMTALVFTRDPDLADAAHGDRSVGFVQVVGVTDDELEAVRAWDVDRSLDLWRAKMPHLLIDPGRPSILTDPEMAAAMAEGARTEGSGSSAAWLTRLHWTGDDASAEVWIPADELSDVARAFRSRLPFDKHLLLAAGDRSVLFRPAEAVELEPADARLAVALTPAAVSEILAVLDGGPGTVRLQSVPGLTVTITHDVP